ncbi:hypothetical protein FHS31_001669 [Sphingomonas vulcanisoli]|uniref:Ice-binding protein C-terminal domain-containing protein n=1 Tax=Sphingomonas vulcanisoli TaxID=1658060 RepID=A0ABX0TV61_9SPHN|nr:PEPxxWA-CTERM sorting domain-containing protein [Sphingomonas vulcanisoli]NIJ08059.1 hypothetical protein [Sphingomonas vulcanisoli]
MKRLLAMLATGVSVAVATPSFAATTVTVPVTFNLATASVNTNGNTTISQTKSISSKVIGAGDVVDIQVSFAAGQSITLNGKIDLHAYLQAALGQAQAYADESHATIKLLNGATTVFSSAIPDGDSGAQNAVGDDLGLANGITYNPADSVTFTGMDLTFTVDGFSDDNGDPVAAANNRSYNLAGFSVSAANATISGVPEPTTWGMMVLGFGALGIAMRRQPRARVNFTA